MPYIYKIYNDLNKNIYIGKTVSSIEERWSKHLYSTFSNPDQCAIHKAIEKHGVEHFFIKIIEECKVENLSDREIYWIDYYNSYINGYNMTRGGDGNLKIDYNLVSSLFSQGLSQKEIAEKLQCERHTISRALESQGIEDKNKHKFGNAVKTVYMIDKNDDKIIKKFNSITEASNFLGLGNTGMSLITMVCKNYPKHKTAYGYKWEYGNINEK